MLHLVGNKVKDQISKLWLPEIKARQIFSFIYYFSVSFMFSVSRKQSISAKGKSVSQKFQQWYEIIHLVSTQNFSKN